MRDDLIIRTPGQKIADAVYAKLKLRGEMPTQDQIKEIEAYVQQIDDEYNKIARAQMELGSEKVIADKDDN